MNTLLRENKFIFLLLISWGVLFTDKNFAQTTNSRDLDYIHYLISNNQSRDAIYFLKQIDTTHPGKYISDSVNYFYGLCFYDLKIPDTAAFFFKQVKNQTSLFSKSKFYESLNLIYTGNYSAAKNSLFRLSTDSFTLYQQQRNLQLCGIHLLERNTKVADSLAGLFLSSNHIFRQEEEALKSLSASIKKQKNKKPLVAAVLSTLVPGLGKYYAGKRGQAVATFFTNAGLGIIAAENYYRGGLKSPQFIITGTIFSFFYFGNILGSAFSVKMAKKQRDLLIDSEIKSSIHKPFRRIFN